MGIAAAQLLRAFFEHEHTLRARVARRDRRGQCGISCPNHNYVVCCHVYIFHPVEGRCDLTVPVD